MARLTSAAGLMALLNEPDDQLKGYGLKKLNETVDTFWAEIFTAVQKVEALSEDSQFAHREEAALLASKVYYHLQEFGDALTYALAAGAKFDVTRRDEYTETILARSIERYCQERKANAALIDPRLVDIVERMFNRCFADGAYKQAVGVAIESLRTDKLKQAITASGAIPDMLSYTFGVCMDVIQNRDFRQTVLRILVELYRTQGVPDYISMCQCYIFLDDANSVAELLLSLLRSSNEDEHLIAYQIAFDLSDNSTQDFRLRVRNKFPAAPAGDAMEVEQRVVDEPTKRIEQTRHILTGQLSINYYLEFLYRHNHSDGLILKKTKEAINERNSVCHSAVVFANSIMHAGTTIDNFLRENMEWLGKAQNWAKFSATASLGVIHKGHLKEGLNLLQPYLPQAGQSTSPYSEGGSLYALGLINANHGEEISRYLMDALRNAGTQEIVQHGAALGLGVAAMASENADIYEQLKGIVYSDAAVAGEAAGLSMGLVMLGSARAEAIKDMLDYARETQHEKIIRGLAMGLALVMYAREEGADVLIEDMGDDKDPILRYGAMYCIALAYCGTGNNAAIRRLLRVAVSDVSDDVRRAAVTALGFVLFRKPDQCPKVVQLLALSYNPHVRYGAALALGIACAGTGMAEAISLLEPMTTDVSDFVRQGAFLALAMILSEQNEKSSDKVKDVRAKYESIIADKHEDLMAKFGAILAQGIIDAGGRNVTISLGSRSGHNNMTAIVGLAVFTQLWYWYPYIHMLSLAFMPTCVIGVDKDLKMPVFKFKSNSPPSMYAYPPMTKPPEVVKVEKVETAVLSVTSKAKAREKKEHGDKPEPMDVEKPASTPTPTDTASMDTGKAEATVAEPEANDEVLENPARVTLNQLKALSFDTDPRYVPIKTGPNVSGIVLLKDRSPDAPVVYVVPKPPAAPGSEEDEPAPPEPFEYTE